MKPKLIAIIGETASGKSSLALEVAKKYNGEIINADSWQVYKGMDVGTAKPSREERVEIPHHLIDIISPGADFTAAEYKHLAQKAIKDTTKRGKLPILVGGTGLYIDSVLFNFSFLPPGKEGERERLNSLSIKQLIKEIKQKEIDLSGIDIRNKRRLVRLLETGGKRPERSKDLRQNTLVIGLKIGRSKLRERIEKRVEIMFRKGLKKEVGELAEEYGWNVESMKGIGYRELRGYLEGTQSNSETKRKIIKNTLNLAKRQRTWFKKNPHINWVQSNEEAYKLVRDFLKG
ncbi:MAG: tRNA (adenosine(37)-N6)-dimethylallyltransferase MiaA [Candidatus Saccharimonadales bacterium]